MSFAKTTHRFAVLVFSLGLATTATLAAADTSPDLLPEYALQYVAEVLLAVEDPFDPTVTTAVTRLELPTEISEVVSTLEWERGQLETFATNKLFLLVALPDGGWHAVLFRDGKLRNDRTIDAVRAQVLRRLYSADRFAAPPAPILQSWLDATDVHPPSVLDLAVQLAAEQSGVELTPETIERARLNLVAEDTKTDELARALGALSDSQYAGENCWAGIWLISRMDKMFFRREDGAGSICDLAAIDAQTFYENVFYAVKARNEFPWGRQASDEDFLHHVLSPRGTGEPLQRWRRHFFTALAPDISYLSLDEVDKAISTANRAYGDYYQYEGDTTWEDFGLLTSLAVHEGRCEDCSNVQNAMLHTIGIPASQTYTPWWGHADGNHAWTWIRGLRDAPGDGKKGVKLFIKTWDGLQDVTSEYTSVIDITVPTESATADTAQLMVWNHNEWRKITTAEIRDGAAEFSDVGCGRNFALLFRIEDEADRVADVRTDGSYRWLDLADAPDETATIEAILPVENPLGKLAVESDYVLELCTVDGWQVLEFDWTATGELSFPASPNRLYKLSGEGIAARPFTVETDNESGEFQVLRR